MRLHKGDQTLVRTQNRSLIVHYLRTQGALSRTAIAERTGLAPSALTRLVGGLLDEGILVQAGKTDSTGGRRPTLVRLNGNYARSIGVKVERHRILAAAVDLTGAIRDRACLDVPSPPDPRNVIDGVCALADRLSHGRTLGVGVCVSGFVDPVSGVDLFTPILGWRDVPLRDPLQRRLRLPVWTENDVNALALAERWYGAGRAFRHFICITVGEGVGAGVVIGGELYRGAYGGAGELGHITIDPDGPACRCGERGCLEAYASDRSLAAAAKAAGCGGIRALATAARGGDVLARSAFHRMGRYLGIGAKAIVNLLNPEAILLGGERMDDADLFLPAFREEVCRHSFPAEADRLHILPTDLGEDGFLIGSAVPALAEFFRAPVPGGAR